MDVRVGECGVIFVSKKKRKAADNARIADVNCVQCRATSTRYFLGGTVCKLVFCGCTKCSLIGAIEIPYWRRDWHRWAHGCRHGTENQERMEKQKQKQGKRELI
jgi:hypothetical protein